MIDKANVGGTVHDINDTGARGMISPDVFSTAAAYEAGEYCIYNNTLYKFTEAKSAGAWDDSKASATDIASELSALNSRTPYGYRVTVELQANVTKNVTCELPEGIDKSYLPIIVYANNSTWQDPYTAEITHQYISGSTGLLDFGVKSNRAGTYTFSVTFLKRDGELSPIS